MMAGRIGDGIRRRLPGFPVRQRPHGLKGSHSSTPRYQVARTGATVFTVGEADRAPSGKALGGGNGFGG